MAKEKKIAFSCPDWSELPDIELYMDQVVSVLERYLSPFFPEEEKRITSTMINNYVKQHLLPAPENKRYGKKHLAYLFIISILKRFMQLSDIKLLVDALVEERGEEGAFTLFTTKLCRSLEKLFERAASEEDEEESLCARVADSCCDAFAAILYSRSVFVSASFEPKEEEEEKEKKEKKEKKAKEKK